MTGVAGDQRLIALFLDMLAAERGAAKNTLLAYGRDLAQASIWLDGGLGHAGTGLGGTQIIRGTPVPRFSCQRRPENGQCGT